MESVKSNWDLLNHEVGYIAHNWVEDGIRCLVLRGPCHWCGYVGIHEDHPAAGFDYDELSVSCHGGLTYAGAGLKGAPKGYYWYGWDYGHSGDASSYDGTMALSERGHKWTADEVKSEFSEALYDFKKFVKLTEKIANRKSAVS